MKLSRGDKLALFGITIGWLLVGGLVTGIIYFLIYSS